MTSFQMYLIILITKLPELGAVVAVIGGVAFLLVVATWLASSTVAYSSDERREVEKLRSYVKWLLLPIVVGLLINFFGVDMKQMALIYGVPAVVNNEQVQKLPNNVLKVVNDWLEAHQSMESTQ